MFSACIPKVARVLLFNLNPSSSSIFSPSRSSLLVAAVTSLDLIANYQVKVFSFYEFSVKAVLLLCSFLYDCVVLLNTLLLYKQTNQNCSAAEETVLPLVITSPLMSCRDPGISPYLVCHLGLTIQQQTWLQTVINTAKEKVMALEGSCWTEQHV